MKKIILLLLLFCNSLYSQSSLHNQSSGNKIDYFESNCDNLKDESGNSIYSAIVLDSIVFLGETLNSRFGNSIANAGDVNGDGYDDIIVGAYQFNNYFGRAYIYFGGSNMDNVPDIILTSGEYSLYGFSVSSAGDVNGDGFEDVIVGANEYDDNTGRAYIYYGAQNMDSIADITLTGESINNSFGYSVSSAGDVNRDGYSDLIVGADYFNIGIGRSYIYYGGSNMNNIADITLTGNETGIRFGHSVAHCDINNDGFSELIVGSPGFNNFEGKSYIYLTNQFIKVNLKVIMEGMYFPFFNQLTRNDSLTAYLHQSISPFNIIDSSNAIIDSLSFTGSFKFFNAQDGTYFISIKHLNTIETWSKSGGEYLANDGSIYDYDFTTANTQAYGNNLKLKVSKYCLFSGDVNQDGYINLSDVIPIKNDASSFISGEHIVTDITGDNIVDLTDVFLCYNNASNFVSLIRP